jgi:hypothetical protein
MLYIGYLGEEKVLSKWTAMLGGFVPFFAMFALVFYHFVRPKYDFANYVLFLHLFDSVVHVWVGIHVQ